MEIKVGVPDASAAAALASFLNTRDRISYPAVFDGEYAVFVHQAQDVTSLKERIRFWADLYGIGKPVVSIDGEPQASIFAEAEPGSATG